MDNSLVDRSRFPGVLGCDLRVGDKGIVWPLDNQWPGGVKIHLINVGEKCIRYPDANQLNADVLLVVDNQNRRVLNMESGIYETVTGEEDFWVLDRQVAWFCLYGGSPPSPDSVRAVDLTSMVDLGIEHLQRVLLLRDSPLVPARQ